MALLLVAGASGCAVNGIATGSLSIRGSVYSATGEPMADQLVEVLFSPVGQRLDRVLNEAGDFGREDETVSATTDQGGEFSLDLGSHVYSIRCWHLPPVGCSPEHPPPPFVFVHVRGFPGEYYSVQTWDGKFRVLDVRGAEIPLADAQLLDIQATSESGAEYGRRWTTGLLEIRYPQR